MSQNGISAGMGQLKPDQCFDIPFASSQKSSMYESIAYRIGDLLKSPSRFFMMLILKIYKLSPGYHIEFSKQAMLDNIVRYSLKSLCLLIGLIGTVTFSSLYLLGGLLQYGLQSQYPRYEIEGRDDLEIQLDHNPGSLSLLTRNCALVPEFVSHYNHLRSPSERYQELLQSIKMADHHQFICLQEVFNPRFQKGFVSSLKETHPYALYNVAPNAWGLSSGLMIMSQKPILYARYVQPPFPSLIWIKNKLFPALNVEYIANKGILFALVKNGEEYQVIITAHLKSSVGYTVDETKALEQIRAQSLTCMDEQLEKFIRDVETRFSVSVSHALLGADLNISDRQDINHYTHERQRFSHYPIFKKFAAPSIQTWLANFYDQQYGQQNYDTNQVFTDVCFDHAGLYHLHENAGQCPRNEQMQFEMYGDQGLSNCSPSSDHAGISMSERRVKAF